MTKNISEAQAGSVLIVATKNNRRIVTVERVTKTQIIIGGGNDRYRRDTGEKVGGSGTMSRYYGTPTIRFPEDLELDELRCAEHNAKIDAERRAAEKRESLRGRTLGFVAAADDAVKAAIEVADEDGKLRLGRLQAMLWQAQWDLESAEKDCHTAADRLRREADDLLRYVERDASCDASVNVNAAVDAKVADVKRVESRKRCELIVRVIADALGAEVKDLIAPMAKADDES
jgi:hypothetical protein